MKKCEIPQESWGMQKLTEFARKLDRGIAVDYWRIGRAAAIVREKLKQDQSWIQWCSDTFGEGRYQSVLRWIHLSELVTADELGSMRLTEAYRDLGILKRKPKPEAAAPEPVTQTPLTDDQAHGEDRRGGPRKVIEIPAPGVVRDLVQAVEQLTGQMADVIVAIRSKPRAQRQREFRRHPELRKMLTDLRSKIGILIADLPKAKSEREVA